jgi:hypothetical protein
VRVSAPALPQLPLVQRVLLRLGVEQPVLAVSSKLDHPWDRAGIDTWAGGFLRLRLSVLLAVEPVVVPAPVRLAAEVQLQRLEVVSARLAVAVEA